jgi:hypothetical protein
MSKMFEALCGAGLIVLFSLAAINHAGAQTCVQPPSGLISWWPGDGNANDIVGPHQGTPLNGVGFAPGKVGQAFSLDGANDEISIAHTSALNFGPNDSFTVDAWLKPSISVLGTGRVAVSLTYVCSGEVIILDLLTDGRIHFQIRDNNNISVEGNSPGSIVDGQWHHVAGVRDVGSHTVELYLDGSLVDSLSDITTGTFTRADAQDRIGSIPVACPSNRYFWAGEIDEVEIFNRALPPEEIAAIYNAGSAGKCKVTVQIDIKPGEFPNDINPRSRGRIDVASHSDHRRYGQHDCL